MSRELVCVVVDDDDSIVEYVKTILSDEPQLDVHGFTSPRDAIGFMKGTRTHILIADVVMPDMDGIDLLDETKKIDPLTHGIMITAYSTVGRVVISLMHGASDFVRKPFETPSELLGAVHQSIERWGRWYKVLKDTAADS